MVKKREPEVTPLRPKDWYVFAVVGLLASVPASLTWMAGRSHYANVWGAPVFAPFAMFGGILALVIALKLHRQLRKAAHLERRDESGHSQSHSHRTAHN